MRHIVRPIWLAALASIFLIASPTSLLFAQEDPDAPAADGSDAAPTGVSGNFSGSITTGCAYDPFTRNFRREIDDIVVPGTVGAYPLKFTRTYNSKDLQVWEANVLPLGALGNSMGPYWRHSYSVSVGTWQSSPNGDKWNGGLVFPDGRIMPNTLEICAALPPPTEDGWDETSRIWTMADGGKMHLGSWYVDEITDPYGLKTKIYHASGYPNQNRITRVEEPGHKYLAFTYGTGADANLITRVEAFDEHDVWMGLRVDYSYSNLGTHPNPVYRVLTGVDYRDGTNAVYHWVAASNGNTAYIDKADDPRLAGPMRHIEYYKQDGIIASERKSSSVPVSTISTNNGNHIRTETRGDNSSATRTFTYFPSNTDPCSTGGEPSHIIPVPADFQGFLQHFTDFNGKTTYIDYYDDVEHANAYRFVKAVTDANGNKTEYIRGNPDSWAITEIIYHDHDHPAPEYDRVIKQTFTPDADYPNGNPYFLASRTALKGLNDAPNTTSYIRDSDTHHVIQINYPTDLNTPASSEEFLYENDPNQNAYGQMTRHRLKNGAYVHYVYNGRHLLIEKSNPTSHATLQAGDARTTYAYYPPGHAWCDRVMTEMDPRENTTQYEYDVLLQNGPLGQAGDPCGGRGLVTKITHPDGKTQSFKYDGLGDKIRETNELGKETNYTYDAYGRVTHIEDPLHHLEIFDYKKPNTGTDWEFRHASNSVFTHTSRANVVTTNTFDNNWRKLSTTVGAQSTDPPTTWFDYDFVGNQTKITDPRGNGLGDPQFTTVTTYDFLNRVETVKDPINPLMTNRYDSRGRIWKITRPDGTEETKTFDRLDRVLTDTVPKDGTPSNVTESITTAFTYWPSGSVHTVTDGEGHVTTFEYNAFDLRSKMIYPQVNAQTPADYQEWTYDGNKNLTARRTAGGAMQTFAYDLRNRKTAMRWSNGVDFSDFDYDDAGRLKFAQNPYSTMDRDYDTAGRMMWDKQTMPGAAPTPVPLIQPPTVVSRKTHVGVGDFDINLPLTGSPGIESRSGTSYKMVATFAHFVTLLSATVSSGIGTVAATAETHPETGGTIISVDLADVSTAQKLVVILSVNDDGISDEIAIPMQVLVGDANANGVVNATDKAMVQGADGTPVTASNFRTDVNASGTIGSPDITLVKANIGNSSPSDPSGTTKEVHYGYDDDGRVTHLWIQGAGYDYTQTYDGLGRLWKIGPGTAVEHQYAYDNASNVTRRINYLNGTSIDYVPDELNRIHDLKINLPSPTPIPYGTPSPRAWFTREMYGYDAMNRLTSVQRDEEPNMSDQFGYYLDGELKSAMYGAHWVNNQWVNAAQSIDYNLDKAGNRTGAAGVTANGDQFNYEPNALNQYTNAHGGAVGNGPNHEITSYDLKNYVYLNDTHLAQVSYDDTQGTHLYRLGYDALGRCVKRTTGTSSVIYYIYDGERPIYEFDPTGGTPSTNVYGRGIDEIIARSNNGSGQYPMQDHEGSVILVTGGDGSILESYRYDAFGAPTIFDSSHVPRPSSLINNRFLFTGREYASQFGFYEYRARAYHPRIGRFMSEDPGLFVRGMNLGKAPDDWSFEMHPEEAELNLFRYCNNDPWDFTDPTGEFTIPLLDAAFIASDIYLAITDSEHRRENLVALGLDAGGALVPGVSGLGKLYKAERIAQRANQARRLAQTAKMTKWGWEGSKAWRDAAKAVNKGGTIKDIAGKIPSQQEAQALLKQAGATVKRIEGAHMDPKIPENYPHINFETAGGKKGSIQIEEIIPQVSAPPTLAN